MILLAKPIVARGHLAVFGARTGMGGQVTNEHPTKRPGPHEAGEREKNLASMQKR